MLHKSSNFRQQAVSGSIGPAGGAGGAGTGGGAGIIGGGGALDVGGAGVRPATILVADDDKSIRTVLTQALTRMGHHVRATGNGTTLWKWVQEGAGDLVITDVMMPDSNGLELLPKIRHIRPDIKIIVMSAQNTLMTAVTATERGAFEYLPKPFDLNELAQTVTQGLATRAKQPASQRKPAFGAIDQTMPLVGRSAAMQEVYRIIARVVASPINVMIHGEAGSGKELVARTIHQLAGGSQNSFAVVNLGGEPAESFETLMVGDPSAGSGLLKQAQGGTLFLDEVGDLPQLTQMKLLAMLQQGGLYSPNGGEFVPLGCRVVSATHRDLNTLVAEGFFRSDLLYRLEELPLQLPALRLRLDDIPELVDHFLAKHTNQPASAHSPKRRFSSDAKMAMSDYFWPGNVRELENFVKRLLVLYSQNEIDAQIASKEVENLSRTRASTPLSFGGERRQGDQSMGAQGFGKFAVGKMTPDQLASSGFRAIGQASNRPEPEETDSMAVSIHEHLKEYFAAHGGTLPPPGLYYRVLRELERPLFEMCLEVTKGNQIKTAELLGLNRNTVRKKLRDLEIEVVRGVGSPTRKT